MDVPARPDEPRATGSRMPVLFVGHGSPLNAITDNTWSRGFRELGRLVPRADVPVVQLSIDRRLGPRQHFELARSLRDLRYRGALILGSGNVVHNLRDALQRMRTGAADTPAWASRFDDTVRRATLAGDTCALLEILERDGDGRLAHPTPDHWVPFIYALAVTDQDDPVRFTREGFDLGSLSLRNVLWG